MYQIKVLSLPTQMAIGEGQWAFGVLREIALCTIVDLINWGN